MKNIAIAFSFLCLFGPRGKYYHKDVKYYIYYAITKEYYLTIFDTDQFEFKFVQTDSRFKNRHTEEFRGVYKYKTDTLILKLDALASLKEMKKTVAYLIQSDSLKLLEPDIVFPATMSGIVK